jgi:diguanylate cyclase
MNSRSVRHKQVLLVLCLLVALSGCGGTPEAEPPTPGPTGPAPASKTTEAPAPTATVEAQEPTATPTSTPTPTPAALPVATTPPPAASRCQGLAGQLEVQVLVGPAEAVGLEPVAVGNVPFAVTSAEPPYLVAGQGPISYEATLAQEWGTYTVNLDMDNAVEGECSGEAGTEQLHLVLEMTGEQMVVVDAEGFHGEYPWSGTQTRELSFPLQEGATAQGEGWAIVLHLGSP